MAVKRPSHSIFCTCQDNGIVENLLPPTLIILLERDYRFAGKEDNVIRIHPFGEFNSFREFKWILPEFKFLKRILHFDRGQNYNPGHCFYFFKFP
jgi:hypothetical protein